MYKQPLLLVEQGLADRENLSPLYEKLASAIRSVDDEHIIFYEPALFGRPSHEAAKFVLYTLFHASLRLLAPFIPFITEEIYHRVLGAPDGDSIHLLRWPEPLGIADPEEARAGELIKDVIAEGRRQKSARRIPLPARVSALTVAVPSREEAEEVRRCALEIAKTLNADEVRVTVGDVKGVAVELSP
ncbi:TPA: hypothetical protein EYP44_05800 [Candidatus Bathyarchaeota archaeon]|nr:hypothetical protein [Candidatus Bathyarchaeota archaeon]